MSKTPPRSWNTPLYNRDQGGRHQKDKRSDYTLTALPLPQARAEPHREISPAPTFLQCGGIPATRPLLLTSWSPNLVSPHRENLVGTRGSFTAENHGNRQGTAGRAECPEQSQWHSLFREWRAGWLQPRPQRFSGLGAAAACFAQARERIHNPTQCWLLTPPEQEAWAGTPDSMLGAGFPD